MELFLDIETIPGQSPALRAKIDAKHAVSDTIGEIKAAGNLKDPDKIAADIAARTAKATADLAERKITALADAEEEWRKTALDAAKGHVFSIAWACGDGPIDCQVAPKVPAATEVVADGELSELVVTRWMYDEAALLRRFFSAIDPTYSLDPGSLVDEDSLEIV
jgi:hypothetical protein